jgi:murein DD-endopeptidase MepM/ murein hydrolase activator NlpD
MKKVFLPTLLAGAAAYVLLPLPGESKPIQKRIDEKRAQISKVKRREGVLTSTIGSYTSRIEGLQGRISGSRRRLAQVQRSLDGKRAELLEARDRAEVARDRLERARRELALARRGLAARLVEIYKADVPDLLTVILSADGFSDLLERTEFLDRISRQDRRVFGHVRVLKERTQKRANELAAIERQAQVAAETILRRRDDVAAVKSDLEGSQGELRSARGSKRALLASVRGHRHAIEEDLESLEREQGRVRSALRGASPLAPVRRGSGRMVWPVNGPITGVFGEARPGHMHAGIDISAPTGTPIRAADSGRVAIAGWVGGYGQYTCIQHGGGLSTCYAHQSRIGVSVGQSVSQGRVIGAVGSTGHSTGPHLHFETRINGSPVNPMGYL